MPEHFIRLKNSRHIELPNARSLGLANARESIRVSIYVRPNPQSNLEREVKERVIGRKAPMTREEYRNVHGADQKDMGHVKKYYQHQGLSLVEESQDRHVLVFRGSVEKVSEAFKTPLHHYELDLPERGRVSYRANIEEISIPKDLQDIITSVFGLDERPAARPYFKCHRAMPSNTYTPLDIAKRYNFPNNLNGSGQTIALIELGGGYYPADLESYFSTLGVSPLPTVSSVSVDGATNMPGISSDDGEVALDIEVAGAVAPGASIAVYFAPNTFAGFLDAVTTAIHDSINNPSVISISWGGPEDASILPWMAQMDQAFQAATALGITVCVAVGDQGSSGGQQHVNFPASSPYVLACGGTSLNGSETVWNDDSTSVTSGGISTFFQLPDWQRGLSASMITDQESGNSYQEVHIYDQPITMECSEIESLISFSAVVKRELPLPLYMFHVDNVAHQIGFSVDPRLQDERELVHSLLMLIDNS